MGDISIVSALGYFGLSIIASLVVLWIAGLVMMRRRKADPAHLPIAETENTFLFHDGVLADHDSTLPEVFEDIQDWPGLRAWLGTRFGELPRELPDALPTDLAFPSAGGLKDPAKVRIKVSDGIARVSLKDQTAAQPVDRHQAMRLQRALDDGQSTLQDAPYAIWKTDNSHNVLWQNTACSSILGDQIDKILALTDTPPKPGDTQTSRISVTATETDTLVWFEIQTTATDKILTHYATDITRTVQAETAQREFVQTLTKTFANLTTGLAIFDRNKQLALFNPALVDLTSLPAEFLSARPTLIGFFDKLRDRQVMPEPKNYADWRSQITAMIETASGGLYQDTWSLPSGVTYRVTGRPHPDGAVAFLFEDISAEISLTRRFRAQNDLRQSVLDKLDHAVAVIAANNIVTFCNSACTDMFGVDPDTSFADLSVRDLLSICAQKAPHADFWKTAETQITCKTLNQPLEQTIPTDDGQALRCRILPVSGGATLICQVVHSDVKRTQPKPLMS